jgi:hypothetical protein
MIWVILSPSRHRGPYAEVFLDYFSWLTSSSRTFKTYAHRAHHINMEKVMLKHNLVSHCVRFALHGAFDRSDPDLATQLRNIEKLCPTLFQRVQTRTDMIRKVAEEDEDVGWELSVDDSGDTSHLRTRVINNISSTTLPPHTANSDTNGKMYRLPRKPINMTEPFKILLRQAYHAEYGFDGNIMIWGKKRIQWAKKFRFDDRYVQDFHFLSVIYCASHNWMP